MKPFPLAMSLPFIALCFLSVIYGALSVHFGWWPSSYIADAKKAATALVSAQDKELRKNWPTSMENFDASGYTEPTVIEYGLDQATPNDLIFILGGKQQLRSHCPDNGCLAWIMDRKGTIRHVWDIGPRLIWEDVEQIEGFSRASNICAVGAHLFDNGDLLVRHQGRNTYLYGAGT